MVDKYANVLSLQIIEMWMTKIRETDAKPAVRLLAYAQDIFGIPMYIHTKTASSAPNYQFFEAAQYLTGPTLLLHGDP